MTLSKFANVVTNFWEQDLATYWAFTEKSKLEVSQFVTQLHGYSTSLLHRLLKVFMTKFIDSFVNLRQNRSSVNESIFVVNYWNTTLVSTNFLINLQFMQRRKDLVQNKIKIHQKGVSCHCHIKRFQNWSKRFKLPRNMLWTPQSSPGDILVHVHWKCS